MNKKKITDEIEYIKLEENATVTYPQIYCKGDIIEITHIIDNDCDKFGKNVEQKISELQGKGLEVEIQYSMRGNWYSVLVIGRLKYIK